MTMPILRPLNRRTLLLAGMTATLVAAGPARAAPSPANGRKLVVVILRGAMDGLAALPKLDDPDIHAHRASLIPEGAVPLADGFALHPSFGELAGMYRAGEAAFVTAASGPYRERSHFEAQDLMESGSVRTVTDDGWLNRALQRAPGSYSAVSIGPAQPLVLRGGAPRVTAWSPPVLPEASPDTLARLMDLYRGDALLEPALQKAVAADAVAEGMSMERKGREGRGGQYAELLRAAGQFLAAADGPDIAVVSLDGWDTHAGQNGALNTRFRQFDQGLGALKAALGPAWRKTAVVAVTEFGRTVRVNGAQGSDHGTGGTVILAGGAIRGGRVLGDWPGLKPAALFENRDLAPTTDLRSVFKGLLAEQMGWTAADLDGQVFPDSKGARAMAGLV
jgi:uncharacterized protein (DUF1501 family)